ncbi:YggT family protein [Acetobacteraceae bacterium KSS8]|uniref:YggT family protein n=1 Tax=Endosaccharibacter trunci TaxID=2812733 RepID=A0ABT1W555_9PROT|nr:YggT family protein [Acetobacteraceae bacterium KSS8]
MVTAIFALLFLLIRLFIYVLLASCIFSLLYAFNVVDTRNRLVRGIGEFLYRATEPVLAPVRRVLPQFGNVDLSPLVVLLALQYLVVPFLQTIEIAIITHTAPQFLS